MQANSSEVPAACEIKLIRDFPPLIYWLQPPQSALDSTPAAGAQSPLLHLPPDLSERVGRGSHQVGPNCGSKWEGTQGRGQGRVPAEDPVEKGELAPRGFQAQAPLPPGHKGCPQPGAPGAQSRRYVQAAGAVEGTHPGLGCGRTR